MNRELDIDCFPFWVQNEKSSKFILEPFFASSYSSKVEITIILSWPETWERRMKQTNKGVSIMAIYEEDIFL